MGDTSRQIREAQPTAQPLTSDSTPHNNEESQENPHLISSTSFSTSAFVELKHQSVSVPKASPTPQSQSPPQEEIVQEVETQTSNKPDAESSNTFGTQIYGQGSIQRLLGTLFPHRQPLNNPGSDHQSD